ncbi:hypothetical protein EVAR_98875_1 [Eumeta japonica]|uniref:Uncharacterized protein n=1 Tax=Eumeta variegata TaxID=151549 RepID=A0A4C2AB17_EUMVA|nr:hypothetical protein EVAR_98875_1 [Eumeta japonica]
MLSNTNIYLKEGFSPTVLQKRKDLQQELEAERQAGKRVVLPYDKIVQLKYESELHHTQKETNDFSVYVTLRRQRKTTKLTNEGTKASKMSVS